MRSRLWRGMLGAMVALPALSGAAHAQCSDTTLTGEYAFGVTAYTPPGQPNGPPQVIEGIKRFDGNGNVTQRDYRGGTTPVEFAPPGSEFGTYTVNPNCTGSLDIMLPASGEIKALIVISDGGRHIHEVVSEFIVPGTGGTSQADLFCPCPPGVHTPPNTSADDWKVAPEGDNSQ